MKKTQATKGGSNPGTGTGQIHHEAGDRNITMNPEQQGLHRKAAAEARTRASQTIGARLAAQYNQLTPTQKVIGGALLTASAVGTAYLTRNLWGSSAAREGRGLSEEDIERAEARKIDL